MSNSRADRVSDVIQSIVAEKIQRLSDPRFHLVTITSVVMSSDLRTAVVYWSALDGIVSANQAEGSNQKRIEEVSAAFESVAKSLQQRVGKEIKLKNTPKLVFKFDTAQETGSRIDELLTKAGF